MKLINNAKDWEDLYNAAYNSPASKPKKYPKEYPCLGKSEQHEDYYAPGGGCGWAVFSVAYFPKTRSAKQAYIAALSDPNWGWQELLIA
jgi:hypothetical protein